MATVALTHAQLMRDSERRLEKAAESAAFQEYERLFGEYFRLFRGARSADSEAADPCQLLLPYLKHEVNEQRRLIIGGGAALAASLRARRQLAQATGDTVRLRALG
jgi:hypothetical protein